MELGAHETKRERKGEKRQKQRKMGLLEKRADQTETGNEREERERESTTPRIEQRKTVSFRKIYSSPLKYPDGTQSVKSWLRDKETGWYTLRDLNRK